MAIYQINSPANAEGPGEFNLNRLTLSFCLHQEPSHNFAAPSCWCLITRGLCVNVCRWLWTWTVFTGGGDGVCVVMKLYCSAGFVIGRCGRMLRYSGQGSSG